MSSGPRGNRLGPSLMSVDTNHEQWLDRYRDQLGRARDEVTTPALLIDLDIAKRNIQQMADNFRDLSAELRPHIKVHKSPQLARLAIEAGAIGVACATAWEAKVMAERSEEHTSELQSQSN